MGRVLLPDKRVTCSTGFTDKTVVEVLAVPDIPERKPYSSTLEMYEETQIFILMDIMEDIVK